MTASTAEAEKRQAALSSVIAAVGLTTFKVIVGVMTGSLGILSEAAHSGLDLVAALMTFFAVRIADKPADSRHLYGHGKVENFSALFETLLLLATCAWIIYEAIQRLFVKPVVVEASGWAFLVVLASIVIDYTRSRVLIAAARKHNSQALEADALHFSTDIWSSTVVLGGLICVKVAEVVPGLAFLHQADAVAALGVAAIVIVVSVQLGRRTISALIDTAPADLVEKIQATVKTIPGVLECHKVRVRTSGPRLFVDLHVVMDAQLPLAQVHPLTETIQAAIRDLAPAADIVVHAEPPKPPATPTATHS